MGYLRFRKSIKLAPGVRINLSKSGPSVSVGRRGASVNIGRRGTRVTAGIPGTGISYTERIGGPVAHGGHHPAALGDQTVPAQPAPAPGATPGGTGGAMSLGQVLFWMAVGAALLWFLTQGAH